MFSKAPVLTDTGKTLMLRAASGEQFTLTHFVAGCGFLSSTQKPEKMTHLKEVVLDNIPITQSTNTEVQGYIQLQGAFDNYSHVSADFLWTELGIIAEDSQGKEYLYAYAYESEYYDLVKAGESEVVVEQSISCIIAVGDAGTITAYVLPHATYAGKQEFDDHVANMQNPHGVTPAQIGAAKTSHRHSASDITSGILPVERGGTGTNDLSSILELARNDYEIGFYTGSGTIRNDITLGYKPKRVLIIPVITGNALTAIFSGIACIEPGKNLYHSGCSEAAYTWDATTLINHGHGGAAITDDGFVVSRYSSSPKSTLQVNESGTGYMYVAFKEDSNGN